MKRLLFTLATAAAFWTAACGSGGGTTVLPPPTGKFSAASLNGQYAFVTNGEVFTGGLSATPLARVGSFTADGKGGITGGVEDVNADGTPTNAIAITGGSYTIGADGRGALTLSLGANTLQFGITLTSASTGDGLMIDETSTSTQASTGSGNFIKQNSASFAVSAVSGPYVFDFSGLDGNQANFCPCPESLVGQFDVSSGTISSGMFDDDDNFLLARGTVTGNFAPDPVNSGFPISTFGRGIAQIAGQNFVFYIVDSTRVRFLSTNLGMLSGDAVAQSNIPSNVSAINSGFAFIVAGSSGAGGLTRVGRFTANGATLSSVLVDTNNAGAFTLTNSGINGVITLDPSGTGRGSVTFKDPNLAIPFSFVFYLSSATQGVIQETSQASLGAGIAVADGSIVAQTGSPFTSSNISGTYAVNWSGLSVQQGGTFAVQDEEDLLGQATISNLNLTGAADIFQFTSGIPQIDNLVGGAITINDDGTGGDGTANRNKMTFTLTKGSTATVNCVLYFVNPQLAFFANDANTGTTRIIAGVVKAQQ